MSSSDRFVNPFPPDMTVSRLEELVAEYRRRLLAPEPGGLPNWYIRAILDVLEARLNDRPIAS
jgi:hypothetical protein